MKTRIRYFHDAMDIFDRDPQELIRRYAMLGDELERQRASAEHHSIENKKLRMKMIREGIKDDFLDIRSK